MVDSEDVKFSFAVVDLVACKIDHLDSKARWSQPHLVKDGSCFFALQLGGWIDSLLRGGKRIAMILGGGAVSWRLGVCAARNFACKSSPIKSRLFPSALQWQLAKGVNQVKKMKLSLSITFFLHSFIRKELSEF